MACMSQYAPQMFQAFNDTHKAIWWAWVNTGKTMRDNLIKQ
jgi:hypothetical protein